MMGTIDILSMALVAWGLILVAKKWKAGDYNNTLHG